MYIYLLIAIFFIVFSVHNVFYLKLTETIFSVKNTKTKMTIFCILCSFIGTVFLYGFGSMSSLGYAIMLMVYTAVVMVYFLNQSFLTRAACILTFNIHIMVARALVSSLISLFSGISIIDLSVNMEWFWTILIITSLVSMILNILILTVVPEHYLKAMTQKTEQMYAFIAIAALANIYLIVNGTVYVQPVALQGLQIHQLIASLTWLFAMYVGLFMLVGFDILRDKKEDLEKDTLYKNMMLTRAITTIEIDCNKDKVIKMFNYGEEMKIDKNLSYSEILNAQIKSRLHEEDHVIVQEHAAIKRIIAEFEKGNSEYNYKFRLLQPDGEYRWLRAYISINKNKVDGEIVAVITVIDDVHESIIKENLLKESAQKDLLVGVYNKIATQNLIDEHFHEEKSGILFLIDLDNFKGINDNMGHAYGDEVLKEICDKITHNFRREDIVGRIGGDEFIVFLKHDPSLIEINNKAKKICEDIKKSYTAKNGAVVTVSSSIGIAIAPTHGVSFKELYSAADRAMYAGKNKGKDTFVIFDEKEHADYSVKFADEYMRN